MNKRIMQLFLCLLINYFFAFIGSHFLKTYCSDVWLHVVIAATTLTRTLSGLGFFDVIVVVVFGLIWNIF